MRQVRTFAILILPFAVFLCVSVLFSSCTPSVRYTRTGGAVVSANKYIVPRNWDYRKSYKVPYERLVKVIGKHLGTPYRFGGMSPKGMDCSGFVCVVFREVNRSKLPHSTRKMRRYGKVVHRSAARAGDLVFFSGGVFNSVNHVGIYVDTNRFAHASTKRGVIYSSLDDTYYRERFLEIRRVF